MKNTIFSSLLFTLAAAVPAFTQSFTGFVGGGFTNPVNPIASRLDTGWNVTAGAGYNFTKHAGLMLDFMFDQTPINTTFLNQVQAPDGNVRTWGFTLDPVFHVTKESPVDVYITGGGGIYHRTVEYTQPVVTTGVFFDPWFGYYPAAFASNQVIGSFGQYKGGIDGGVGFSVKLGSSHLKLFAEARYHHIFTRQVPTDLIPVTFGIRW
ncbi:MAG TPA: outer membrane beta-barrel protein [Candidatus Acidoferrales bacterium]|nr:outer membrane beta-barrel protein [Candidatus Acidoferrales bacterium]